MTEILFRHGVSVFSGAFSCSRRTISLATDVLRVLRLFISDSVADLSELWYCGLDL